MAHVCRSWPQCAGLSVLFVSLVLCGTLAVAEPPAAAQDARREQVSRAVVAAMDRHGVPGASVAVISDYGILWSDGYGTLVAEGDEKVTPETLFQAASISKSVAAGATLRLAEQGRLDLDGKVNELLKSWQIPAGSVSTAQPILVKHLLSHSAGLTVHGFEGYATTAKRPTLIQILNGEPPANSPKVQPIMKPDYKFRYSGGGYCVLQQLLIDTTGEPFAEFMQAQVLTPLAMTHSSYEQPLTGELARHTAVGHREEKKVIFGGYNVYPEMAAAGLWTTPSDLARYAIDIAKSHAGKGGVLLSQQSARRMLTRQNDLYGLGFFLKGEGEALSFSHGGANEGFRCQLIAYPATGQGVAIMTNSDTGGLLCGEIAKLVGELYLWPKLMPAATSP